MEGGVAAYIRSYLSGCGAEITLQDIQPGRQNLMARLGGDLAAPALVLCCHMDTVVFGDGWSRDPLGAEEAEGRIYGRGSCDMKSGLACALSAFRKTALGRPGRGEAQAPPWLCCALWTRRRTWRGSDRPSKAVWCARTTGSWTWSPPAARSRWPTRPAVAGDRRPGVTAHASRPEQGADAIAAAGELIARARRDFLTRAGDGDPVLGRATITFGQITGGYQPYVVPDRCRLWVDMRLAPPIDSGTAQAIFREAAAQAEAAVPGVNVSIEVTGDRPCIPLHRDAPLLRASKTPVKPSRAKSWRRASSPATPTPPSSPGPWGTSTASPTAPGTWSRPTNPTNLLR